MNKKEILEIRRLLSKENTRIERIAGCYVDGEKQRLAEFSGAFYSAAEEVAFKYSEIFRKTLSGTIGKNLHTLAFSLDEEMYGSRHSLLLKLQKTALLDEEVLSGFYDRVISSYVHTGNYLILLAFGMYDIPAKTKDNEEVFDGSDYVYPFVLCDICPVNLSKGGLCFDAPSSSFVEGHMDWMVEMPETGFLFPAFNDRNSDIHSILYYGKKPEELHGEFTSEILGCAVPETAMTQKSDFNSSVEEVFGTGCSMDTVMEIHENLNRLIEEKKDDPEPLCLGADEIKSIFRESGAKEEKLAAVEKHFKSGENQDCEKTLAASNLAVRKNVDIKTQDISLKINAERTDLIETRIIDGREYILIPLTDEIKVNGITIYPKYYPKEGPT